MLRYCVLLSVVWCVVAQNIHSNEDPYSIPNIKLDIHHVVTEDLYILEVHRLQNIYKGVERKKHPVLIFHGLLESSDRYVEHGRNLSLAYSLADAGFDVWLGNNRGNKYSRYHKYLNPDDPIDKLKFFNYTYENIGVGDVAAIVDYILNETNTKKLHYIGHSQGGTVFFALNSLQPRYNDKFLSANLLAGVGYQEHFPNPLLHTLADVSDALYTLLELLGFVEVFGPGPLHFPNITMEEALDLCFGDKNLKQLCQNLNKTQALGAFGLIQTVSQDPGSFMGGGAVKQLAHFGQNIRSSKFRRWDYGDKKNILVYGTKEPPQYNISLITIETTLHYGNGDVLLNEKDVLHMAKDMANARARKVAREDFSHSDFLDAADAKELVYDFIIDALLHFEGGEKRKPRNIRKKLPLYVSIINALDLAKVDDKKFDDSDLSDTSITNIVPYTTTEPNLSTSRDIDSSNGINSDLVNISTKNFLFKNISHSSPTNLLITLPNKHTIKLDLMFDEPNVENRSVENNILPNCSIPDVPGASIDNVLTKPLLIIMVLTIKMI